MISDRLQVQRPQMSQGYDWLVNQKSQELLNKFKKPVEKIVEKVGEQIQGGQEAVERFTGGILPTQAPVTQTFNNYNPALYKGITKDMRNKGVDFGVKTGTPVSLPDGNWIVKEASTNNGFNRGYGNSVMVENEDTGERMRMSHLSRVNVLPGQKVRGGSLVGLSGATGNVTGPHLDLEYYDKQGRIGDVTKSRYGQQLFGQGGGGMDFIKSVNENTWGKLSNAVLFDEKTRKVLPMSPVWTIDEANTAYKSGDKKTYNDKMSQLNMAIVGMTSSPTAAAKRLPVRMHPDDVAQLDAAYDAIRQGVDKQAGTKVVDTLSDYYLTPQQIDKVKGDPRLMAEAMRRMANRKGATPVSGSAEQMLEMSAGWNPGTKAQFDYALLTNDKATIKKMLPSVPNEYKMRFADKISNITGGK